MLHVKSSIVDASFIETPKRRNTEEQREKLKKCEVPEEWEDAKHPQKLMQRDTDATWTKRVTRLILVIKTTLRSIRTTS